MPFNPFAKKFSPKKSLPRKAVSLSALPVSDRDTLLKELHSTDPIQINLDGNKAVFDGKDWVWESGANGAAQRELKRMKRDYDKIEEENNLLKLKIEILLDMLAKSTAEQHIQSKEIDDLKHMITKSHQTRR